MWPYGRDRYMHSSSLENLHVDMIDEHPPFPRPIISVPALDVTLALTCILDDGCGYMQVAQLPPLYCEWPTTGAQVMNWAISQWGLAGGLHISACIVGRGHDGASVDLNAVRTAESTPWPHDYTLHDIRVGMDYMGTHNSWQTSSATNFPIILSQVEDGNEYVPCLMVKVTLHRSKSTAIHDHMITL
jgi:hypothetical protein